jgi:hypothetical protein
MTRFHLILRAVVCVAVPAVGGCNVDRITPNSKPPKGPVVSVSETTGARAPADTGLKVVGNTEVDLVERMVEHRSAYLHSLEALRDYYRDQGYLTKQSWADFELAGLKRVQTFRYVMDAEIPAQRLRPEESIASADAMYDRGIELMRKGGHGGLPALYREGPMVEAVGVFRELIEQHPGSDKIDDAAFMLGEIHKEYLKNQELIAVQWYERSFTWDPATPHPARFQAAVVYDYRLHDRDRALELYRLVLQEETSRRSNVDFATRRIEQLTKETSRSAGISAMPD